MKNKVQQFPVYNMAVLARVWYACPYLDISGEAEADHYTSLVVNARSEHHAAIWNT
jgi:hypothetical protein